MAAITICSDFGAQKNKFSHCFHYFPIYLPRNDGTGCHALSFLNVELRPPFSFSSFTFIKRIFSSSSLSALRVVSSAYLRLLIFLPAILIPACASSSPAFLMMYSAYKLNKQGDNIQPRRTPFPIWNQSVVPCPVLTVVSWPAYRCLKRQVRWSGIPISFRIFHLICFVTLFAYYFFYPQSNGNINYPRIYICICFLHHYIVIAHNNSWHIISVWYILNKIWMAFVSILYYSILWFKYIQKNNFFFLFSSVQSLSRVWLFTTPWTAACQAFCPSPTPGAYSNSCPSSRWCHPTISSYNILFLSCLQYFFAFGSLYVIIYEHLKIYFLFLCFPFDITAS